MNSPKIKFRSERILARFAIGFVLGITLVCVGCNITPDFSPPGTVYQQRNRAVVYDPFPGADVGPTIEGMRPMGFDKPLSEVRGSRENPFASRRNAFGF